MRPPMRPPKIIWYCRYTARSDYPRSALCQHCAIPKDECPGIIKYPRAVEGKK